MNQTNVSKSISHGQPNQIVPEENHSNEEAGLGSQQAIFATHNSLQEALTRNCPIIVVHPPPEDEQTPSWFDSWFKRKTAPTHPTVHRVDARIRQRRERATRHPGVNRSVEHSHRRIERAASYSEEDYDQNPHLLIVDEEEASRMNTDELGFRSPFRTPHKAAQMDRPVSETESSPTRSKRMEQNFEVAEEDVSPILPTTKMGGVTWLLGSPPTPRDRYKTPSNKV